MDQSPLLSVVIPIGPEEEELPSDLLSDLNFLPDGCELIFTVSDQHFAIENTPLSQELLSRYIVKWVVTSSPGRAVQMNAGAEAASGLFLWFLHLDSRFSEKLVSRLLANLQLHPEALHYCLLAFMRDGPLGMRLNGLGANVRSFVFGTPFGDQGLALSRASFYRVGGYPENVRYGEDHLFVWHSRQKGLRLRCCREYLMTSARKYQSEGWFFLTMRYQYLWIKQAWPELTTLIKKRYF